MASCVASSECISPMICNVTNNQCQCGAYQYFDPLFSACRAQTIFNTTCSANIQCRVDLGLSCQNLTCACNPATQYWSVIVNKCLNYLAYSQSGCAANTDCMSSLICNLNAAQNPCNCPTASVSGACDCVRTSGNEQFWNGTQCVSAYAYTSTQCNTTYQCRTLTENTQCLTNQCKCYSVISNENFFNGSRCVPSIAYGLPCPALPNSCQTLTQGTQCIGGICSCSRISGSEFYWSGSSCVPALALNSPCTSNQSCQIVTQKTSCYGGFCTCANGIFSAVTPQCVYCDPLWYFYGGKCFYYYPSTIAYDMSTICASLKANAYFAVVDSSGLRTYLNTLKTSVYVGWVNGTAYTSSNNSICLLLTTTAVVDYGCTDLLGGFCEYNLV